MVQRGEYTDFMCANPAMASCASGRVVSDGKFALVRTRGDAVVGYVLAGGAHLGFNGQELASSTTGPVCLANDGKQVSITGPQGAAVTLAGLGAVRRVICNHNTLKAAIEDNRLHLAIPVLRKTWKVRFSEDGTLCTVTGDGPQPLKIHGPRVINVIVNGVSTYFSRGSDGDIYPKLGVTVATWGDYAPQ